MVVVENSIYRLANTLHSHVLLWMGTFFYASSSLLLLFVNGIQISLPLSLHEFKHACFPLNFVSQKSQGVIKMQPIEILSWFWRSINSLYSRDVSKIKTNKKRHIYAKEQHRKCHLIIEFILKYLMDERFFAHSRCCCCCYVLQLLWSLYRCCYVSITSLV